ncbi:MAG: RagB/SusD family nutrient uptake outer membrane protein [Tannerella sp.]|jgi:hypothetical protein|nr:RagB/SusD family nutrient uptake outer membrane protein [Tannerella sp.]
MIDYIKRKLKSAPIVAFIIGEAISFSSCDFLDIEPYITDLFTLDTVFSKQEYAQAYLHNLYGYIIDNGSYRYNARPNTMPWGAISDDCVPGYKRGGTGQNYAMFCNGELTPEQYSGYDRWDYFYEGIRRANTFLMRINECKEVTPIRRQEWIGEATFIKANIYFELMLAWGPVPVVPNEPVDFDTPIDKLMIERSTWDECSNYVEGLLRQAIELLPDARLDVSEIGKATKNAARAVMSRLTLYTASPLYNGSNSEFAAWKNNAGVPYLNPVFSMEKWAKAAAAAKELVDIKPNDLYTVTAKLNTPVPPVPEAELAPFPNGVGGIDHFHSYKDMFDGECVQASTNIELLFTIQNSDLNDYTRYMDPGMIDGWSGMFFPQRIVDAYLMADGRDINNSSADFPYEASGYTELDSTWSGERTTDGFTLVTGTRKWYANREPRFYATVAFNNSYYPSTSTRPDLVGADGKVAKYFANSVSGKEAAAQRPSALGEEYPMTGYLCRKFTHYEDSWLSGGRRKKKYAINYRMAEVYLNYVEAMNELDGSHTVGDVTVSRNQQEMMRVFNLIRHRAGLPGITAADVSNKAKMRTLIEHERLIEMMWEGRRYFDIRRNKTAIKHENEPIMGLNLNARSTAPDDYYYISRATERSFLYKVFTTRMTFWPVPKHEIDKNYNLDQLIGY